MSKFEYRKQPYLPVETTDFQHLQEQKEGELKAIFQMSGEKALDILDRNRNWAEKLSQLLPSGSREMFQDLMRETNFKDSPRYQNLVERIDWIRDNNRQESERFKEKIKPLIDEEIITLYKQIVKDNDQETQQVQQKLDRVSIFTEDYYRFYALLASGIIKSEEVAGYFDSQNNVAVISLADPTDKEIRLLINKYADEIKGADHKELYYYSILIHEILHAASYRNYWWLVDKDKGQSDELTFQDMKPQKQRVGISVNRPPDLEGEIPSSGRLRWLNEGITESLARKILPEVGKRFFAEDDVDPDIYGALDNYMAEVYEPEQEVLEKLKVIVPEDVIYRAYFTRNGLLELNRDCNDKLGYTLAELEGLAYQDPEKNVWENLRGVLEGVE